MKILQEVKNKIAHIIAEEIGGMYHTLHDPMDGKIYYPQGLNHEVVRLFENVDNFYQSTLDDEYWKEISDKFPNYNSEEQDTNKAVDYIISSMKKKYPDQEWNVIEKAMRSKVHGGIT